MILQTGEMYQDLKPDNVYLATTNGILTKDKLLVMGKGSALQLKTIFPQAPKSLGALITSKYNPHLYGLLCIVNKDTKIGYGAFQTKMNFTDPSTGSLIIKSLVLLKEKALKLTNLTFHLPFPSIGLGTLPRPFILKLIQEQDLPNNIIIWEKN